MEELSTSTILPFKHSVWNSTNVMNTKCLLIQLDRLPSEPSPQADLEIFHLQV